MCWCARMLLPQRMGCFYRVYLLLRTVCILALRASESFGHLVYWMHEDRARRRKEPSRACSSRLLWGFRKDDLRRRTSTSREKERGFRARYASIHSKLTSMGWRVLGFRVCFCKYRNKVMACVCPSYDVSWSLLFLFCPPPLSSFSLPVYHIPCIPNAS